MRCLRYGNGEKRISTNKSCLNLLLLLNYFKRIFRLLCLVFKFLFKNLYIGRNKA